MLAITLRPVRTVAAGAISLGQTNQGQSFIQTLRAQCHARPWKRGTSGPGERLRPSGILAFSGLPLPRTGQSDGRATQFGEPLFLRCAG
jgi:hypothetical protein